MPNKVQSKSADDNNLIEDPNLKKHISWQTWLKLGLVAIVVLALIAYLIWDVLAVGPITHLLTNRDQLVEVVSSWGVFAPIIYIVLQIIQTVVAPIPGQIVGGIGGFVFGPWGILWTTIGTILGCYLVFRIARRFGRPLLEKLFKKSIIDKFDFILNSKSTSLVLFLIFLLPGFPDDVICYLAGLTKLPIRRLMIILILGRFPVIVVTNFIGEGISTNLAAVVVIAVIVVLLLGLAIWQRERLMRFLKRLSGNEDQLSKSSDQKETSAKSQKSH